MSRKQTLVAILLTLFLVSLAAFYGTAVAQGKSFRWENWDSDITLLENGQMEVQETHTLEFSGEPFTFGYRTIQTGSAGSNDGLSNISVQEGDIVYTESGSGAPYTYTVTRDGDETTIRWYFEPALGRRTYVFNYTVEGGVIVGTLDEGSGDQIFWTVVPADHPGPVDQSSATIHLPEGIQPQQYTGTTDFLAAGYINDAESDQVQTSVSEDGRTVRYVNSLPLLTGQSFAVRTQFPHGLLAIPKPDWQRSMELGDTLSTVILVVSLLLLVGGPLLVLLLWYLRGRDPQLTVVVPEYVSEPPGDLRPAIAGALIDEKVDMQDVVSTLIDLANRGYLTMTEEGREFTFARVDKADDALRPFEKQFLKDVFRGKTERSLDSLRYKFASRLPGLRTMIYQELVDEGLVSRSPQSVRTSYGCLSGAIFAAALATFIGLLILMGETVGTAACPGIALFIIGVVMIIVSRYMPRKTAAGAEAAAKWSAFKIYLQNVEKYSDLEQSGEIFARYLPYAVAFGLERTWIRKFSAVPSTPIPPWYFPYPYMGGHVGRPRPSGSGSGGDVSMPQAPTLEGMSRGMTGGLAAMSAGLTRMLNSTSTVLKSTPPSSSGSSGGFSGGFSGGGGFSAGGGGSAGFG